MSDDTSNQPRRTLDSQPLAPRRVERTQIPMQPEATTPPPGHRPGPRRIIPAVPIGPARPDPDPSPATPIERALAARPLLAAAIPLPPNIVKTVTLTSADDNGAAASTDEPSVATVNNLVFYTGNWYAALSQDGGDTFQYVDPFHSFPDPPGMGFCCDQIALYIPQIDMFVWLLQYTPDANNENIQRLAFATSAQIVLGQWATYDIAPQSLGLPNVLFDFPDLAFGTNSLYVTTNAFGAGGQWNSSIVLRIPLAAIQSGNITADHVVNSDVFSFRVAQYGGTRAFWAAHLNTSTLRIFSWDEGAQQATSQDVGVSQWNNNDYVSQTPDNFNWLGRSDPRVLGASAVGEELWFSWNAGRGGVNNRPQPYTQVARLKSSDFTVVDNINVWDPDSAIAYAALASNVDGIVGATYTLAGPQQFPAHVVGILGGGESHATVTQGQHGPQGERWGDFLTIRRHQPEGKLFAATGYTLKNGSGDQDGTPELVLFGPSVIEPRVVLPENLEAAARKLSADARAQMLADPRVQKILAAPPTQKQLSAIVPTEEVTPSPGKERWPVKTGTDDGASAIDLTSIQPTTVEQMTLLPRPDDMDLSRFTPQYQSLRAAPAETTVWQLEAEITAYKFENDGDYHLVIRSDNSYEMIAEIPDPDPAFVDPNSPFAAGIANARQQFDTQFPDNGSAFRNASQRARITGVGLFDIAHGQRGFAQTNGIEIHPVLDIQFLTASGSDGTTNDGSQAAAPAPEKQIGAPEASSARRIVITVDLTNI